ncbi:hypothetical protein WK47_25025 [Burkholderia ubonensis]|nr:hypothetical protein WJ74_10800 [Burkholderia ubonensis]KVT01140.1 hypothetical protein WK47_25025 [Burkholderia ubonensis]KVT07427.1 hypothetical protein WK46_10875 [Burkholderia ubonensis]KVT33796.1 hypothetical protein WK50_02410 [Burkholderia ubonensis]
MILLMYSARHPHHSANARLVQPFAAMVAFASSVVSNRPRSASNPGSCKRPCVNALALAFALTILFPDVEH